MGGTECDDDTGPGLQRRHDKDGESDRARHTIRRPGESGGRPFGKNFKVERTRVRASIDIYNALNSNAILTINTAYSTTNSTWLRPTSIMPGRLIKFGATVDF
jgi:hypothetical protein